MPELPEVEALAGVLRERAVGHSVARVDVAAFSVLKTYDPPLSALSGLGVREVHRHGKFLDVDVDGVHLVVHLARAGWLQWRDPLPAAPPKPGRGPLAARVHLDTGAGFDLTEAGTQKRLAMYVVRRPADVPGVAALGPDVLDPALDAAGLGQLLRAHTGQLKGVLRDQSVVAGIGNAYSDEILHAARLSPFASAARLDDEEVGRLHAAVHDVLGAAVQRATAAAAAAERPTGELKSEKKSGLRVHGRGGQPCPVCGDTIRDVFFADSSLQYCPTCQTGGRVLADRRLSRIVR